jgi:DNA-binding response OmpR family regulator
MSTTTRPQKTVLVVEDDPWIRSLMADLLAGEGYAVVQASDGKAGLEMAEESDPDVILLDLPKNQAWTCSTSSRAASRPATFP